jgi:cadmium resistance protein CadD (predicted permease)
MVTDFLYTLEQGFGGLCLLVALYVAVRAYLHTRQLGFLLFTFSIVLGMLILVARMTFQSALPQIAEAIATFLNGFVGTVAVVLICRDAMTRNI